jgi:hypothetical protein
VFVFAGVIYGGYVFGLVYQPNDILPLPENRKVVFLRNVFIVAGFVFTDLSEIQTPRRHKHRRGFFAGSAAAGGISCGAEARSGAAWVPGITSGAGGCSGLV